MYDRGSKEASKGLDVKGLDRERISLQVGRGQAWRLGLVLPEEGMKDYVSGHTHWMTPKDKTPPLGSKMLLLNPGGVCVIGHWSNWAVAWAPLPKVQGEIKELLMKGMA